MPNEDEGVITNFYLILYKHLSMHVCMFFLQFGYFLS